MSNHIDKEPFSVSLTESTKFFITDHYKTITGSEKAAISSVIAIETAIRNVLSGAYHTSSVELQKYSIDGWYNISIKQLSDESGKNPSSMGEPRKKRIPYINDVLVENGLNKLFEIEEVGYNIRNKLQDNSSGAKVSRIRPNPEHIKITGFSCDVKDNQESALQREIQSILEIDNESLVGVVSEDDDATDNGDKQMLRENERQKIFDTLFTWNDGLRDDDVLTLISQYEAGIFPIAFNAQTKSQLFDSLFKQPRLGLGFTYKIVEVNHTNAVGNRASIVGNNNYRNDETKREELLKLHDELDVIATMMYELFGRYFIPLRPYTQEFGRNSYYTKYNLQQVTKEVRGGWLGGTNRWDYDVNVCAFAYFLSELYNIESNAVLLDPNGTDIYSVMLQQYIVGEFRADYAAKRSRQDSTYDGLTNEAALDKFIKEKGYYYANGNFNYDKLQPVTKAYSDMIDVAISELCPYLYSYVKDKNEFRNTVISSVIESTEKHFDSYELINRPDIKSTIEKTATKFVKQAITAVGFGATLSTTAWIDECGKYRQASITTLKNEMFVYYGHMKKFDVNEFYNHPYITGLASDLKYVQDRLLVAYESKNPGMKQDPKFSKNGSKFSQSRFLAYLYQNAESNLMNFVYDELYKYGKTPILDIYDGFIIDSDVGVVVRNLSHYRLPSGHLDYVAAYKWSKAKNERYYSLRNKIEIINETDLANDKYESFDWLKLTSKNLVEFTEDSNADKINYHDECEIGSVKYRHYFEFEIPTTNYWVKKHVAYTDEVLNAIEASAQKNIQTEIVMRTTSDPVVAERCKRELNMPLGTQVQCGDIVDNSNLLDNYESDIVYTSSANPRQVLNDIAGVSRNTSDDTDSYRAYLDYIRAKNELESTNVDFEDDSNLEPWV